jgi:hypothetical protein
MTNSLCHYVDSLAFFTGEAAAADGTAPDGVAASGSEQQQPSAAGTAGSAGEGAAAPAPKKTVKITAQKFGYMKVCDNDMHGCCMYMRGLGTQMLDDLICNLPQTCMTCLCTMSNKPHINPASVCPPSLC